MNHHESSHRRTGRGHLGRICVVICLLLFTSNVYALEVPWLESRVTDQANVLSQASKNEIEAKLAQFEADTSNQLAVLIIPSLEGENLEEFSLRVAETWELGQAGLDNGVLLLIAKEDRKLRIEVGYGLEGDLTDALARQIIDYEIVPHFRSGDFETGVSAGVDAIIAATAGSYTPPEPVEEPWWVVALFLVFFLGIFLFVIGIFTYITLITKGPAGWFLYFFLMPFWFAFPSVLGPEVGFMTWALYSIIVGSLKFYFLTSAGDKFRKSMPLYDSMGSGSSSSGGGWSSGGGGSSFSGGGGSFGGGGSSGSW